MTTKKTFLAGLFALSLPLAAIAQAAPAEPAKPAGVSLTPYGFVSLVSLWTGGTVSTQDYPSTVSQTAHTGGSFLMSARQSRVGARLALDDGNWTGATIGGVIEFDFNGGQISGANVNAAAPSTAWYNGLMRLRLANMTANWKTPVGNVQVLAGQDYGLVNTLFAESITYIASPLFWKAGNIWRRSPQIRATWSNNFDMVALYAAVAVLSPADAAAPVDLGQGNLSRTPDMEGRVAATVKANADFAGTIGVGFQTNKRRFNAGTTTQKDVTASTVGVDVDLNLTKFAQVKGEYYSSKGSDDTYNGVGPGTTIGGGAGAAITAVGGSGYWAQAILKPLPELWVTAGYGSGDVDKADRLKAAGGTALSAATQIGNTMLDASVIVNAGKYWRFGVEYLQVTTKYVGSATQPKDPKAQQVSLSTQLKF
jgi:hypothetical protein